MMRDTCALHMSEWWVWGGRHSYACGVSKSACWALCVLALTLIPAWCVALWLCVLLSPLQPFAAPLPPFVLCA